MEEEGEERGVEVEVEEAGGYRDYITPSSTYLLRATGYRLPTTARRCLPLPLPPPSRSLAGVREGRVG